MRTTTNRAPVVLARLGLGIVALSAATATLGALTTTQVATVTRTTTASPDAIWSLWADVPNRTSWDTGLVWARMDGPFQQGATGEVRLKDQPTRRFQVVEFQPPSRYTDRFFLPMGTHMDWHHSIDELGGNRRQVTFRVEVSGPTALILAPIAKKILGDELPETVDRLTAIAEGAR
jgi:Polyketide cyclase / dehydrase and lipid transport